MNQSLITAKANSFPSRFPGRPKTLSTFSFKCPRKESTQEVSTPTTTDSDIRDFASCFEGESEWDKIYQGADEYLDRENMNIVSPSPVLQPRTFVRSQLTALNTRFTQISCSECSSALLPKKSQFTDPRPRAISHNVEDDALSLESGLKFKLTLSNESSALLKRRNLLKGFERSTSLPKLNSRPSQISIE